jgi:hypothetical protein
MSNSNSLLAEDNCIAVRLSKYYWSLAKLQFGAYNFITMFILLSSKFFKTDSIFMDKGWL